MLNMTQHTSTTQQLEAGVVEPNRTDKETIKSLLTFEEMPSKEEIEERAIGLRIIASSYKVGEAMIGGAPYLMSALERELKESNIVPCYAFSKRESVERLEHGSVIKTNVFKHIGFYKGGI